MIQLRCIVQFNFVIITLLINFLNTKVLTLVFIVHENMTSNVNVLPAKIYYNMIGVCIVVFRLKFIKRLMIKSLFHTLNYN